MSARSPGTLRPGGSGVSAEEDWGRRLEGDDVQRRRLVVAACLIVAAVGTAIGWVYTHPPLSSSGYSTRHDGEGTPLAHGVDLIDNRTLAPYAGRGDGRRAGVLPPHAIAGREFHGWRVGGKCGDHHGEGGPQAHERPGLRLEDAAGAARGAFSLCNQAGYVGLSRGVSEDHRSLPLPRAANEVRYHALEMTVRGVRLRRTPERCAARKPLDWRPGFLVLLGRTVCRRSAAWGWVTRTGQAEARLSVWRHCCGTGTAGRNVHFCRVLA